MSQELERLPKGAKGPNALLLQDLCKTLGRFSSADELETFLVDLCTPEELRSLSERWRVAKLVEQGVPYRKIQDLTGVSTATITRVARALLYGNGYKSALDSKVPTQKVRRRG